MRWNAFLFLIFFLFFHASFTKGRLPTVYPTPTPRRIFLLRPAFGLESECQLGSHGKQAVIHPTADALPGEVVVDGFSFNSCAYGSIPFFFLKLQRQPTQPFAWRKQLNAPRGAWTNQSCLLPDALPKLLFISLSPGEPDRETLKMRIGNLRFFFHLFFDFSTRIFF